MMSYMVIFLISSISFCVNIPLWTFSNQKRSASLSRSNCSRMILRKSGPGRPSSDSSMPPTNRSTLSRLSWYSLRSFSKISGLLRARFSLICVQVLMAGSPKWRRTVL
uniref:Putative secreted protein n=1 Tax=Ixodes ricinus TaxID=34613 RepID=A0A6B0U9Y8_IXORI